MPFFGLVSCDVCTAKQDWARRIRPPGLAVPWEEIPNLRCWMHSKVSKKATPAPLNQVTLPPSMPYDSVAPHLKESASYLSQDEEAFSAILLKAAAYLPLLVNTILIQTPIMLVRWLVSTESSTESQHKDTSTMTKDLESGLYLEKCSSRSTCTTLLSVQEPGGDSRPVSGFDWLK